MAGGELFGPTGIEDCGEDAVETWSGSADISKRQGESLDSD